MTVVVIIVVWCLVIMCKWINCLSDLSMMDCSEVTGKCTARVSARENFWKATPTLDWPRPLPIGHAHFLLI